MDRLQAHRAGEGKTLFDYIGVLLPLVNAFDRPAYQLLLENSQLGDARSVLEIGGGTGYLAQAALSAWLPDDAEYVATERSGRLSRRLHARLGRFGERATCLHDDGSALCALPSARFDRVLSSYVLDGMSPGDFAWHLGQIHRLLRPGGLLCLLTLSSGRDSFAKAVMSAWSLLHRIDPRITGMGRPIPIRDLVTAPDWDKPRFTYFSRLGFASDLTIATRCS